MRIDEALHQARGAGLDRADAEILLAGVTGRTRTQLRAWPELPLDPGMEQRFQDWCRRRLDGTPVAYLLGKQEFHGLAFAVDASVLVPRPETELLVDFALRQGSPDTPLAVADLGTGSGAIACAVAFQRPRWIVSAVDRSKEALATAQRNGAALGLRNVEWLPGDWYEPLASRRFDLVLSNPPYLAAGDPHLADLRHEPVQALVAGPDGLECLRALVQLAPAHLAKDGWLALEHGWTQSAEVRALLRARGFVEVLALADLAGIDRVAVGRWPA